MISDLLSQILYLSIKSYTDFIMMSKTVLFLITILWFVPVMVVGLPGFLWAEMGPLHVQNRYPLYLMFLTPEPDTPKLIEPGQWQVSLTADYTSVYINEQSSDWSVLMDMEMIILDLGLTYGLTPHVNLALTVPWISMQAGFLDGPLGTYHEIFGFPDYGRPDRPENEYGYHMVVNNEDWVDGQSGGLHLGETVIAAKLDLIGTERSQGFASSLSAALKVPTGDVEKGFGSGRHDQFLVLLNRYRLSPISLYLNPGYVWLSDPDSKDADIQVDDMVTLFVGLEWEVFQNLSGISQLNYMTSPLSHTRIPQLDQDSLELVLGLCYSPYEHVVLEAAFSENLTRSAPDFTLHGGLRWTFGH